jgi:Methane/Phenol/Toluene Hydroxylase
MTLVKEDYRRALLNPDYDAGPAVLEERRTAIHFANPYGARISEYEQVLLFTQPNPDWIPGGIGVGGWSAAFPGGRGAWENYFTEAKTSDWFVFRDPEGRWQRPYVAEKADEWREFERLLATFASQGLHRRLDPRWTTDVLAGHLGALAFHDYGVFMALASPIRDCLVDTLRAAVVTSALDFLDNAQLIQAERIYLGRMTLLTQPDLALPRALWLNHPAWRGTREVVEEMWGKTYDHIELLFVLHVLHEPLFGRLARGEFFASQAAFHGDQLTPRVLGYSARAAAAARTWTVELFGRTLGGDPAFGDYNRKLMRYWAEKWLPLVIEALRDFSDLWQASDILQENGAPRACAHSIRRVIEDWYQDLAPLFDPPIGQEALVAQATAPHAVAA